MATKGDMNGAKPVFVGSEKDSWNMDPELMEDAAEGFGSRFGGQVLGTFGKFGVLSFNGNKMITTSGGALITAGDEEWREIMMYATQYRESYPYYQHEKIGYYCRMSNICAGIGIGRLKAAITGSTQLPLILRFMSAGRRMRMLRL